MNIKQLILVVAVACLTLAACDAGIVPIEELAQEVQGSDSQALTAAAPTATAVPTPMATATPLPPFVVTDDTGDCVTLTFLQANCNFGLQRDVTQVELELTGQIMTITVTIEGQPWGQAPDHFAVFQFDNDKDTTTGSTVPGNEFGIGTEVSIFWGWTSVSLPFGIELYDESGEAIEVIAERDEMVTIIDEQTLQLQVDTEIIGSESFNFVFSLQSAIQSNVNDNVPQRGEFISFPADD